MSLKCFFFGIVVRWDAARLLFVLILFFSHPEQLVDQERLHKTQIKEERLLWRKAEKFHVKDKNELREKVSQIQSTVAGLENQIEI